MFIQKTDLISKKASKNLILGVCGSTGALYRSLRQHWNPVQGFAALLELFGALGRMVRHCWSCLGLFAAMEGTVLGERRKKI